MSISLKVNKRAVPAKERNQRRLAGVVPAELYGKDKANQHLEVDAVAFEKVYKKAGQSTLIDLMVNDDRPTKVLIYDVQQHPVTSRFTHVDFYQIDMDKTFIFTVPVEYIGESKAVKELEGTLVKDLDAVEISCLPNDLVSHIEVDISVLQTFDDTIRVKDLKVPPNITVKSDPDMMVASVMRHYVEEAPKAETLPEGVAEGTETKEAGAADEDKAADKSEGSAKDKK